MNIIVQSTIKSYLTIDKEHKRTPPHTGLNLYSMYTHNYILTHTYKIKLDIYGLVSLTGQHVFGQGRTVKSNQGPRTMMIFLKSDNQYWFGGNKHNSLSSAMRVLEKP